MRESNDGHARGKEPWEGESSLPTAIRGPRKGVGRRRLQRLGARDEPDAGPQSLVLGVGAVASGRWYAFRYLGDAGSWFDDEDADAHEPNGFGGTNGVIDLETAKAEP